MQESSCPDGESAPPLPIEKLCFEERKGRDDLRLPRPDACFPQTRQRRELVLECPPLPPPVLPRAPPPEEAPPQLPELCEPPLEPLLHPPEGLLLDPPEWPPSLRPLSEREDEPISEPAPEPLSDRDPPLGAERADDAPTVESFPCDPAPCEPIRLPTSRSLVPQSSERVAPGAFAGIRSVPGRGPWTPVATGAG